MIRSIALKYLSRAMAATLLIAVSCGNTPSDAESEGKVNYNLTGTLNIAGPENVFKPEPAKNYLVSLYEMSESGMKLIDSVRTDNSGKYRFSNKANGDLAAWLSLGEDYQFPVFGKNGDNIVCNISIGNRMVFEAKGNKLMENVAEAMKAHFDQRHRMSDLNDSLRALKIDRNDQKRIDTLSRYFEERMRLFEQQRDEKVLSIMNANKDNPVGAFIVTKMLREPGLQQMDDIYTAIQKKYPEHPLTKELGERVKTEKPTAIGSVCPEIELADPEGKKVKLSSLRGKYVLIDFWASWCKPCRAENPNNVKVYNRYKAKGFEIYGISFDNNKESWVEAIKKDGLPWYHVSELSGWTSTPGALFKVHSIPYTVLIDPTGKIIAKNIRGQALADKLAEIFPGN